jgi:hypothetical protein
VKFCSDYYWHSEVACWPEAVATLILHRPLTEKTNPLQSHSVIRKSKPIPSDRLVFWPPEFNLHSPISSVWLESAVSHQDCFIVWLDLAKPFSACFHQITFYILAVAPTQMLQRCKWHLIEFSIFFIFVWLLIPQAAPSKWQQEHVYTWTASVRTDLEHTYVLKLFSHFKFIFIYIQYCCC